MTKKEEIARKDDNIIAAAELALELLSDADKLHLYTVCEFTGCGKILAQIEPPAGKKDERSLRHLYVSCAIELLRMATALRPVRVEHFTKA